MIPRAVSREFPAGWGWKPPRPKIVRKPRSVRVIPADMLAMPLNVLVKDLQAVWGISDSLAYELAAKARAAA
jgi:hypothetical protein